MNKVLSAHFRAYIQALEKLQIDVVAASDSMGVETRITALFLRGSEPLKNRSAVCIGRQNKHFKGICFVIISLGKNLFSMKYCQINIALWPRFKMVFDMHLNSLRNVNVKTLWEDDFHPHYVMRRYAEFTVSFLHLNVEYGDGQLELNLERFRMAVNDLLNKLAKSFPKLKLQTVFLTNNYDMTIAVLKEAGIKGGKMQLHFEGLRKSSTTIFVEELLVDHFSDLIKFVKTRAFENMSSGSENSIIIADEEPHVKDFGSRRKAAIEIMHKDVLTYFSNFLSGMEILRAALTQLVLYYTRFTDSIKRVAGGTQLNKDLVSLSPL